MKIEKLKVKNFRTLEDVTINFEGCFSSISGKNNAGKTTVIRSIKNLFGGQEKNFFYHREHEELSYSGSKTQWSTNKENIVFDYLLSVNKNEDPGLHSFIVKIAEMKSLPEDFTLQIIVSINDKNNRSTKILVEKKALEGYATQEIYKRISSSGLVFFHNSTASNNMMFYSSGMMSFHEMILSKDEKEELEKEQEKIKNKVKKFAKEHRGELSGLLGKLEDKYEVELTLFEGLFRDSVPLGISLKDKSLEVPLDDWGAGTQNKTHIMMSILSASRIKQQDNDENRITPIIIIEEPESFLHPSAQAEFGRVIRDLSRELGIQIIITTHSPYMLCQEEPESNILLERKTFRGQLKETKIIPVSAEKWMEPFSEILGLNHDSIEPWREVVGASKNNAILVEGKVDKEYLETISSRNINGLKIPENVEIVSYDGKDALKNVIMLQFAIKSFERVYITFDLDAKCELKKTMEALNLIEVTDYMAIGDDCAGKQCIEGWLPEKVLSKVSADNYNLVMGMSSSDPKERKTAKNQFKQKLLQEFKTNNDLVDSDFNKFTNLFKNICKAFK